jgi:hypothetical protein
MRPATPEKSYRFIPTNSVRPLIFHEGMQREKRCVQKRLQKVPRSVDVIY